MTFIERVKKIDIAALRAHRAFPLVVTGWLVLLLGAGAYIVQGSALHAALGAIAGGLLGRYLATRMGGAAESSEDEVPETERDKRLRRVLGPEEEAETVAAPVDETVFDENPDADLDRILASRSYRPQPVEEVAPAEAVEAEAVEAAATSESAPELAQDAEPQYLSIEELELEGGEGGFDANVSPDADFDEDDGEDDGSDDAWPAEAPEWANPGAALAEARGDLPEPTENPEQPVEAGFEPAPEPQPDLVAEPGEHAAAKLRSQDLSQMSLVQMIERLAFAMDDYREAQDRKSQSAMNPASETADEMAATLRALPALTRAAGVAGGVYATDGNAALDLSTREEAEATEDALRDALEKLQKLSGG